MDDTRDTITKEDVDKLISLQDRDAALVYTHGIKTFIGDETVPIIRRMWKELQHLRSILSKQIY